MANQQAFQAYPQSKGTLLPGQSISVNKYNVQVERYLSQGGFAHVYLVRTPTPVYNTTHHVLKRIAVANETMLTEVKKEVDIMRLLKGHPNIVHLIDAAWHKMPNGMYEVFILMEYCPGGGIIDMMNRRLRERLTEAEILQIFVDVCEGVAYMHNSRPPLLHRDLKVENILQSSSTSYKLCDFGSATSVSRPPSTTQEIRAVEADLNRHTTLQYRAPEMVDVYSKRPIDEKSDVWALGVLLYKLCYYTTPFEEHGPLAILNVQYRTPSYPVYSTQMNMLIASMLREHGAQRPSVFELLAHVHRLRGTKSQFQYNIPVPQPLSPRHQFKPSASPNPLEGTITYAAPSYPPPTRNGLSILSTTVSPPTNQGIQAREKVLEAIAPMRRGRPLVVKDPQSSCRQPSPQKNTVPRLGDASISTKPSAESGFAVDEDKAWNSVINKTTTVGNSGLDDAWTVGALERRKESDPAKRTPGFGDDFAEKLWSSSDPNAHQPRPSPKLNALSPTSSATVATSRPQVGRQEFTGRGRDAFDGLGLMASGGKPSPTLGEARKLRTGLASMSTSTAPVGYNRYDNEKLNVTSNATSTRTSPSPRLSYNSQLSPQPKAVSPIPNPSAESSGSSLRSPADAASRPSSPLQLEGQSAENRFPSLEELDAKFPGSSTPSSSTAVRYGTSPDKTPPLPPRGGAGTGGLLKPAMQPMGSYAHDDGTRSAQVTGVAMRQSRLENGRRGTGQELEQPKQRPSDKDDGDQAGTARPLIMLARDGQPHTSSRPVMLRKHRSSISIKHTPEPSQTGVASTSNAISPSSGTGGLAAPSPRIRPRSKDWLTGEDEDSHGFGSPANEVPVLRESPSKRASFIERSNLEIQEAAVAQHGHAHAPTSSSAKTFSSPEPEVSPTLSRFARNFPPIDTVDAQKSEPLTENWSPVASTIPIPKKEQEPQSSSSEDEPENPSRTISGPGRAQSLRVRRKGRQSSVHDLVDLWGGAAGEKETKLGGAQESGQQRSRPVGLSATSYTKPISNSTLLSPPTRLSPSISSPSPTRPSGQPLSAASATSTSSGRSRPQSMFIFPSKSADISSLPSPGLAPPEEPKPRAVRRTSISDMVQRYEAIGGKAKLSGPPSPIALKSAGARGPTQQPEKSRFIKPSNENEKATVSAFTQDNAAFGESTKRRSSPKHDLAAPTPINAYKSTMEKRDEEKEKVVSRVRTSSFKQPASNQVLPARKGTVSIETKSPQADDTRSPSPDRPYQGVGKLIDQWQRKTAEADTTRSGVSSRRGGYGIKRAGLVHGAADRG